MNGLPAIFVAIIMIASYVAAQTMPPEADKQLARAIYKEMIEIKSGYSTGATTPVAEAAARRLRAAGFPDADIFIGGARPPQPQPLIPSHRPPRPPPHPPPPPPPPRRAKRAGRGLDREPDSLQARRVQAGSRHHRRAHGGRGGWRPVQRRAVAAQEQARADRRRAGPERGRLGRIVERRPALERRPAEREVRDQLSIRGAQQGRP